MIRYTFIRHSRKLHDSMSEECHTHLVSFIKHHGLFVPYIGDIFTPNPTFLLTRKSWFTSSHTSPNPRVFFPHTCYSIQWFLHLIIIWYRVKTKYAGPTLLASKVYRSTHFSIVQNRCILKS